MASRLTTAAISRIQQGSSDVPITVQVLKAKALPNDRYQLVITDGSSSMMAMLATQCSFIMKGENPTRPGSILLVKKFMLAPAQDQQVAVLLNVENIGFEEICGNPSSSSTNPPVPPASTTNQNHHVSTYGQQQPIAPPPQPHTYGLHQPAQTNSFPSYGGGSVTSATGNYGAYSNYGNTGSKPVQKDETSGPILPISAINPYSNRWTIKARVTSKSQIRSWSNARGQGTLFSIDLLDAQGGEIRATFFKESCDKFYAMIEEGKVYTFSGGTLKIVQNRQYSSIKNQYELTFNPNASIVAVNDANEIRQQNFNFVKVVNLSNVEVGATVDIVGVVRHASEVSEIVSQKQGGKTLQKREITVADDTLNEVRVTLWGEKAVSEAYSWHECPIVAMKGLKVGDYGGRSLSAMSSTVINVNPQIPEGFELHKWRESLPHGINGSTQFASLSAGSGSGSGGAQGLGQEKLESRKPMVDLKDGTMGMGEKPDYATVKGSITYIKHDTDPYYAACSQPNCNKKVVPNMNGDQFTCEKCNITSDTCERRYILNLTIADHSGNTWVTLFNEQAEKLLGMSAQQLYEIRAAGDESGYEKVFSDVLFKTFIGRVRVKQEQLNDEQRIKVTALTMAELDYAGESEKLITAINTCMM